MADELKPCPFDGAEASLDRLEGSCCWRVMCGLNSFRCGNGPWKDSKKKAIAAWNRRTPSPRVAEAECLEIVAAECHKQWSGWTEHLLSKTNELPSGNLILGQEWKARWMKQVNTPYAELSESEKESDRREARKILAALNAVPSEGGAV